MPDRLSSACIRTRDEFNALRVEWAALFEQSSATPFQSPEWLLPWWDAFGSGELLVIAVRQGERLAGLAPLYICDGTVRLIGTGNSDYLDIIAATEMEGVVAQAVLERLAGERSKWRDCDFLDLPASSALLQAPVPAPVRAARTEAGACPVIRLPDDPQALDAIVAARLRKGFRQYQRRSADAFRFERATGELLPEYLEAFFGLHGARWRASGETGVLADPCVREFHRCAAQGLWFRGLPRLNGLRDSDGHLRAVQYSLARGTRVYAYLAGYDPELDGFSPGTILLRLVIEDAIRAGFREFDFVRGREPYKYDWGARDEITWRLQLSRA